MTHPTDIMATRYTAKHYDASRRVTDEDMARLLEAARLSPTSVNAQLTRYWLLDTPEAIERVMPGILDFNQSRVREASHLLVIGVIEKEGLEAHLQHVLQKEMADGKIATEDMAVMVDKSRRHFVGLHTHSDEAYIAWATAQAYISLGALMVLSAQMGIDSTALEGLDYDALRKALGNKPEHWRPVVAISFGYHAEDDKNRLRPKSRLALEDVVHYER